MSRKHSHYYKDVRHLSSIDVYRVLDLFGVKSQAVGHAIKKLLLPGGRGGGKELAKDLSEARDTIDRALEMLVEDQYIGKLEPRQEPETVQMELAVKVDPAAQLLADAVKILQAVEGSGAAPMADQTIRIHARALLRRIENAQFTPLILDRNEAAVAQGVDLSTTEELSIARSRMTLLADKHDAASEREVDSYSHMASTLVKGAHHGG